MSDINKLVQGAAVAFLHREIAKHGQVRMVDEDFAVNDNQQIRFDVDPVTGEIVFRHNKVERNEVIN